MSGFLDMRKLAPGAFQDFNFGSLKIDNFENMSNVSAGNIYIYKHMARGLWVSMVVQGSFDQSQTISHISHISHIPIPPPPQPPPPCPPPPPHRVGGVGGEGGYGNVWNVWRVGNGFRLIEDHQGASVSELPAALRRLQENIPPDLWKCLLWSVGDFKPRLAFSKYDRSDQMTMPARRASKSCARGVSQGLKMFFSYADFFGIHYTLHTIYYNYILDTISYILYTIYDILLYFYTFIFSTFIYIYTVILLYLYTFILSLLHVFTFIDSGIVRTDSTCSGLLGIAPEMIYIYIYIYTI